MFRFLIISLVLFALDFSIHAKTLSQTYTQLTKITDSSALTELVFAPKSSELDMDAQSQLREFLKLTAEKGPLREVRILAWPDQEYPQGDRAHGADARKLADERADEVDGFFEDRFPGLNSDTYNMAERPHELEKLFATSDARLKRDLEKAGFLNPKDGKLPGHAGRVLVLVVLGKGATNENATK